MSPSAAPWPAGLSARPLLVHEPHALAVRDAFVEAERRLASDPVFLPAAALASGQGDAPRFRTLDGVAVVPVSGVLLSRGDFFGEGAAYTSYGAIVREVGRAAADPAVRGIVLAIGSPGGVVEGVLPAAAAIREARGAKPVIAHVGSLAASAAYWLAAQADEIVLADDLSQVGSIGVYTLHMDVSRLLTEAGIDVTVIASGRHKVDGHPFAPLPDSVRAAIQTEVDDLRLMFARAVADGRPALSADLALATEARVFRALDPRTGDREAITHHLADRVERLDRVIGELSGAGRRFQPGGASMSGQTSTPAAATPVAGAAAPAAPPPGAAGGSQPAAPSAAPASDPLAAAREEGRAAGLAEGETRGVAAERTRIAGILGHAEAQGRDALARHFAFETATPVNQVAAALKAAPKAEAPKTDPLAALAAVAPAAVLGAPPPGAPKPASGLAAAVDAEIARARR